MSRRYLAVRTTVRVVVRALLTVVVVAGIVTAAQHGTPCANQTIQNARTTQQGATP